MDSYPTKAFAQGYSSDDVRRAQSVYAQEKACAREAEADVLQSPPGRGSEVALGVLGQHLQYLDSLVCQAEHAAERIVGPVPETPNVIRGGEEKPPPDLLGRMSCANDGLSRLIGRLERAIGRICSFV